MPLDSASGMHIPAADLKRDGTGGTWRDTRPKSYRCVTFERVAFVSPSPPSELSCPVYQMWIKLSVLLILKGSPDETGAVTDDFLECELLDKTGTGRDFRLLLGSLLGAGSVMLCHLPGAFHPLSLSNSPYSTGRSRY